MIDLTTITTPFGLLDEEVKMALVVSGPWDYYSENGWTGVEGEPLWLPLTVYRLARPPAAPDSINWSHVTPEWKWMARDENGNIWLYSEKPECGIWHDKEWSCDDGNYIEAKHFVSLIPGTTLWQSSLVERGSNE